MVGRSGIVSIRCGPVTASARSWPARNRPCALAGSANTQSICPLITSVNACGIPRYGTCCIWIPSRNLKSSAAPRLDVLPLPNDNGFFALLRQLDEFGNIPGRKVRPHRQHHRYGHDTRDRRKVRFGIVRQRIEKTGVRSLRRIRRHKCRVAIRLCLQDRERCEVAIRARLVFNHNCDVGRPSDAFRQMPRHAVGRATRREWHDQRQALGGIGFGRRTWTGQGRGQQECREAPHKVSHRITGPGQPPTPLFELTTIMIPAIYRTRMYYLGVCYYKVRRIKPHG
jgi:hypothetical protein